MVNGRIYNARTMDEIGNHPKKRAPFYWELPGASDAFVWHGRPSATRTMRAGVSCVTHAASA
jgi:hypothetical protein